MPKKQFSLRAGEPKNLEIRWERAWKNVSAEVNGRRVLVFVNATALRAGAVAKLEDGSQLSIRLRSGLPAPQLETLLDGEPVPGSATDPETVLGGSYGIIFAIAGLSTGMGLLAELAQIQFMLDIGMNRYSIVLGAFFAVLGYFVKRRSMAALTIAVAFLALDTLTLLALPASEGDRRPIGALIVRIIFLVMMARGFPAISKIRKREGHLEIGEKRPQPVVVMMMALLNSVVGAWLSAWSLLLVLGFDTADALGAWLGAVSPLTVGDPLFILTLSIFQMTIGLGMLAGRGSSRLGFLILTPVVLASSSWMIYQDLLALEPIDYFHVLRIGFFVACTGFLMLPSVIKYFDEKRLTPVDEYRPWKQ